MTRLSEAEKDELVAEIEAGCEDAKGDNPEVGEDDIVYEIAKSMTTGLHKDDAREVQQRVGIYL